MRNAIIGRFLDEARSNLFADVRGRDGALRQHQHEGLGPADRTGDRVRVQRSGFYVARRDPAPDSVSLQGLD